LVPVVKNYEQEYLAREPENWNLHDIGIAVGRIGSGFFVTGVAGFLLPEGGIVVDIGSAVMIAREYIHHDDQTSTPPPHQHLHQHLHKIPIMLSRAE